MAASEMKINLLHALENFLDMYEQQPSEVMLIESIANSIDAGATKIDIYLDEKDNIYRLVDNGSGMSKDAFENYHTIALSNKDKSKGIGFAGVGAKIYLASWQSASIVTETCGDDGCLASKMYREGAKLVYDKDLSTEIQRGTSYTVNLSPEDFKDLEDNITKHIVYWYNMNLIKGLKINVNGEEVKAWKPKLEKEYTGTLIVKKKSFNYCIWLSEEDLPEYMLNIVYTVYGKRVKSEMPTFFWDVKSEFKRKLTCIIECDSISDLLTSNKEDFRKTPFRNLVVTDTRAAFLRWLKENDLIIKSTTDDNDSSTVRDLDITQELNKILETDDYSWMNPWGPISGSTFVPNPDGTESGSKTSTSQHVAGTKGGNGSGGGITIGGPEPGAGYTGNGEDINGEHKNRTRKGLGVIFADIEEDYREGWVDVENKAVVINLSHPLAKKIASSNSKTLYRYNLAKVIIVALIQYSEELGEKQLTATEAFKIQTGMLTKLFTQEGSDLNL